MARDPSILDSPQPSAIAPASPAIAHVQLRDLIICPREQGIVNYVVQRGIAEQDLNAPGAPTRVLSNLGFTPNSLASIQIGNDTLIAAGGQDTEIHLSYHVPSSSTSPARRRRTRKQWEFEENLTGSINNSVLLTSLSLTRSNESSIEPRVGISNNDNSVRLYDVPLRVPSSRRKLVEVGQVRLDVPVNHSSISPDGRTLLSVGDSNKIYFHQITGGAQITFQPITTLTIPPPDSMAYTSPTYSPSSYTSLAAAFSTAFSGDGTKFAVASQEGVVAVWDVRSTKPMKVFHTNKMRSAGPGSGSEGSLLGGNGGASGWLSDDPLEWTRGTKAPGWCVRSVKFNSGGLGKEVMAFTEHTSLVHVVDARTFETHETIRVPALPREPTSLRNPPRRGPPSHNPVAIRRMADRFREMRRMAGITVAEIPLSRAELLEAQLGDQMNSAPSTTTNEGTSASITASRNLVRRLLPVSNARQNRRSVTPEDPGRRLATRRAAARSAPGVTLPSSELRPVSVSARYSPASASRLTTAASAREVPTSGVMSALTTTSPGAPSTSPSRATPSIVQALGDAFRIPLPPSMPSMPAGAYSAPASIGDSTWRTLSGAGAVGAGSLRRVGSTGSDGSGESVGSPTSDRAHGRPHVGTISSESASLSAHDFYTEMRARYRRSLDARMDAEEADRPDEFDGDGIVVVPDLGDRDVESEVHAVLAVHGIESRIGGAGGPMARTQSASTDATATSTSAGTQTAMEYDTYMRGVIPEDDFEEEDLDDDDMERVDEDHQAWFMRALTSIGTSNSEVGGSGAGQPRSSSDSTNAQIEHLFDYAMADYRRDHAEAAEARRELEDADAQMEVDDSRDSNHDDDDEEDDFDCVSVPSRSGSPTSGIRNSTQGSSYLSPLSRRSGMYPSGPTASQYVSPPPSSYKYFDDLDIAGLCFDPWGEKMYVAGVGAGSGFSIGTPPGGGAGGVDNAGVGAVVEWSVRGADKRWWVDDGWI